MHVALGKDSGIQPVRLEPPSLGLFAVHAVVVVVADTQRDPACRDAHLCLCGELHTTAVQQRPSCIS